MRKCTNCIDTDHHVHLCSLIRAASPIKDTLSSGPLSIIKAVNSIRATQFINAAQYHQGLTVSPEPHSLIMVAQYHRGHTVSSRPHSIIRASQYHQSHTVPSWTHSIIEATQYHQGRTVLSGPHSFIMVT